MLRLGNVAEPDPLPSHPGGMAPAGLLTISYVEALIVLLVFKMAETLDEDVHALKEWLRGTWRQLADPSLTSFDRREIRNLHEGGRDRGQCRSQAGCEPRGRSA